MASDSNREIGKVFEELFKNQAKFSGLLALKNPQAAQYTYNGKLKPIPGDLDFKLIDSKGNVGYFDCKSFDGEKFSFSELKEHQVDRACLYNEWGVPAGFVVCFRESRRVVYYPGGYVKAKGPRTSFSCYEGLFLGFFENFNLKMIMLRHIEKMNYE
jgi:hypothetical protein